MTDPAATEHAETFLVRTPHGVCKVTLARRGLALGNRGGFDAQWSDAPGLDVQGLDVQGLGTRRSDPQGAVLSLEAFRAAVKAHLSAVHLAAHGQPPGHVTLNLSSHQLIDDLIGWTKLNSRG